MEFPRFDVDGQVALVTGASRGIGRDLVLALAHAGATVVAAARSVDDAEAVVEEVRSNGGRGHAVELDLRDRASIERAVHEAVERPGRLDILVNNAGLGTNHQALEATEEEWDELLAVNVRGLFFASQSAGRHMVAQRDGQIINLSSQAGLVGIPRHAAYSASKGAVNASPRCSRSNGALTGSPSTPWHRRSSAHREPRSASTSPSSRRRPGADPGRAGRHHEGRRRAVIYLASPASSLVTVPCLWSTEAGPHADRSPVHSGVNELPFHAARIRLRTTPVTFRCSDSGRSCAPASRKSWMPWPSNRRKSRSAPGDSTDASTTNTG